MLLNRQNKNDVKKLSAFLQGAGFMDILLPPFTPGAKDVEGQPGFKGEKHAVFVKKDDETGKKTLIKGAFVGPQTRLKERLARGDKPVDGANGIDSAAKKHDIAYMKAGEKKAAGATKSEFIKDIHEADEEFIKATREITGRPISAGIARKMIQLKRLGETVGILPTEVFSGGAAEQLDFIKPLMCKVFPPDLHLKKEMQKGKGKMKVQEGGIAPLVVALIAGLSSVAADHLASFIEKKISGKGLYGAGMLQDVKKRIGAAIEQLPMKAQVDAIHKTIKKFGIEAFDVNDEVNIKT